LIPIRVRNLSQSTHCAPSHGTGVVWGQSLRATFRLERLKVIGQLCVQVGIEPAPAKHVDDPRPDHMSPVFARNLAITATVVSQFFVSS
jgi:hypothetical protein